MRGIALLSIAASLLYVPLKSGAEESVVWKNVGSWKIAVDTTLGYGCFMMASYTHGEVFRIGFDRRSNDAYFILGNDAWKSLEVGQKYDISLKFDADSPWTGGARAINMGTGVPFLYLSFDKIGFLKDISVKNSVSVYYGGKLVSTLPLTGTVEAMNAVVDCQQQIEQLKAEGASNSDPFANQRPVSDPFRR